MSRSIMIFLAIVLVLLQYRLWLSHDGVPALIRLHTTVEKQRRDNEALTERNEVLSAEVQDLKSGLEALEERARSELGMVKPGETFFQVIEKSDEQD